MNRIRTQTAVFALSVVFIAGYLSIITWTDAAASEKRNSLQKIRTETLREDLSVAEEENFTLETFNGRVEVVGWDKNTVRVVAEKRMEIQRKDKKLFKKRLPFTSESEADAYFAELKMDIQQEGDGVQVHTLRPKHKRGVELSVRYEIYLPKAMGISVDTSNGSVLVSNTDGSVSAHSSNGRIHIAKASGPVIVQTSNGKVVCEDVRSSVDIQTSNGKITVLHPASLARGDQIRCRTSNGTIRLGLDSQSQFSMEADTTNGQIRSDFEIAGARQPGKRTHLAGVIGTGGTTVSLRTSNGSINIEKL